jgi:hypothetical protein
MRVMTIKSNKSKLAVIAAGAVLGFASLAFALTGNAVAAGHAGHGAKRGAGHSRGSGAPVFNSAPPMSPTFNPSYQYILPEAPETPVSPGSPGSVFGND